MWHLRCSRVLQSYLPAGHLSGIVLAQEIEVGVRCKPVLRNETLRSLGQLISNMSKNVIQL